MAHKKAGGSTDNGRDSNAKRRGIKLFGGQRARSGNIILRQKGTKWFPGEGVQMGRDFTIFAIQDGVVKFTQKRQQKFNGQTHYDVLVNVVEAEPSVPTTAAAKKKTPVSAPQSGTSKKKEEVKKREEAVTAE